MKTFSAAIFVILVCAVLVVYAPEYLYYSDRPQKMDAVVLFLGNEYKERRSEAVSLIKEGYASHLVIPAYGKVTGGENPTEALKGAVPVRPSTYPAMYEDTHVEILEAKRLMDKKGLRSAILVSSPYHMRRIKLIADRVLPSGTYRTLCVPSRFERRGDGLWLLHEQEIKKVTGEYGKIVWFFLYRWFA